MMREHVRSKRKSESNFISSWADGAAPLQGMELSELSTPIISRLIGYLYREISSRALRMFSKPNLRNLPQIPQMHSLRLPDISSPCLLTCSAHDPFSRLLQVGFCLTWYLLVRAPPPPHSPYKLSLIYFYFKGFPTISWSHLYLPFFDRPSI